MGASADLCFKLPDNVSLEEGAMCEPLSVGVHACRRANVGPETNILVLGAGPIGLVSLLAARAFGAPRIVIVDVDDYRLSVAKKLGADETVKVSTNIQDVAADIENIQKAMGAGIDVSFDCAGFNKTMSTALGATRPGGKVCLVGMGHHEMTVPLTPAASYVLLTSMYAVQGNWAEVARLRRAMRDRGVRKEPGCSWIKYKNRVHIFSADDKSSPFSNQIYAELEKLNSKMIDEGYVPDVTHVMHNVEESDKIKLLNHHSERLAIAFGLIFIPPGLPIRVVKNLRVCGDCHSATKIISKITQREILVRDAVRFHLFKDGKCSCGDFW